MEQGNNIKAMSERAMYHGTLFGFIMIVTNILYILGLKSPLCSTLFLGLTIASPFIAGRFAIAYRKQELGNSMTFSQAWLFLIIMYTCSAILTAVAQFVYFQYFDNGYFMEFILEQFATLINSDEIDAMLKNQFIETAELLKKLSTRDIVLQLFSTNIMIAPIITLIIAIFVRKN